jgi:hypothetical protein
MAKMLLHDVLPPIVTFDEISERLFKETYGGYCLWVGAGITFQLTSGFIDSKVMLWSGLVSEMENAAGLIQEQEAAMSYAERLGHVQDVLGQEVFQQQLRKSFLLPLCESLNRVEKFRLTNPNEFRRRLNPIMKLGYLANPIVNFNIEHYTSVLLAFPFDYWITSFKQMPVSDIDLLIKGKTNDLIWQASKDHPKFKRRIYHPHGVLDLSGTCVLTNSEYSSLMQEKILGYRLAIHTAFHLPLVIVGMSLEDKYLREQLENFRYEIDTIYWFVDKSISESDKKWAQENRITLVISDSWEDFWRSVHTCISIPPITEYIIGKAWEGISEEAIKILEGKEQHRLLLSDSRISEEDKIALRQLAKEKGMLIE